MAIRARVHNGRLLVDEPTGLPEGKVLDLVVDDEGDDLDDAERDALHARLDEALATAGDVTPVPVSDVLARLARRA